MKKMETGKVALNLEALAEDLEKKGFVVVKGIYLDTNKTTLKPDSKPAIDEVAKLLKKQPGLKLYVVGHTDMQGSLSHDMNLSKGRDRAVVTSLVNNYGVAPERLEGHGVGPLAPVANNAQETSRARNRRVVLIEHR